MATILGKTGTVKSGGSPTDIGEIQDFSLTTSVVITEDPSLGDDWITKKPGTKSWSATVNANFDNADAVQDTLIEGAEVALEFYPDKDTTGGLKLSGTGIVSGVVYTNSGNDPVVSVSFTVEGNGALTRADVI
jgi:hypothetical protein